MHLEIWACIEQFLTCSKKCEQTLRNVSMHLEMMACNEKFKHAQRNVSMHCKKV